MRSLGPLSRCLAAAVLTLSGFQLLAEERPAFQSPVEPEAAMDLMRVAPGVRVELVACEPTVIDPVAIRFDERGRMWVVEMRDYPHGPNEGQPPLSQIRILEDRDGDGRYETAVTFADKLLFATGVLPFRLRDTDPLGAFVTLAGKVVYMQDTDGDLQADKSEVWYQGFMEENPQLRANHPRLGMDGFIYIANGLRGGAVVDARRPDDKPLSISGMDFRFDPRTRAFEAITGMGQFGLTFDDFGERFVCSNRNPMKHIVIEDRYLRRNPAGVAGAASHDVAAYDIHSRIFPISRAWTTSNLHAGQFTAACGVCFYRGDALGEAITGSGFTCDPTGNLVHREVVRPQGATFTSTPDREGVEFLASFDEWFRPVNLETGPDGALYVVDMYRAVIEHPQFMPDELKTRADLRYGDDRGRIYRVVSEGESRPPHPTNLADLENAALIQLLEHPNSWQRETAARLLAERDEASIVDALQDVVKTSKHPAARVQALWLVHRKEQGLSAELLQTALSDAHPRVREHAVRLAESRLADAQQPGSAALRAQVLKLAEDENPRVRFQTALALGFVPGAEATTALVKIGVRGADDVWTRRAVSLSLKDRATEALVQLLAGAPGTANAISPDWMALISETAAQAGAAGTPAERQTAIQALAALEGSEALERVRRVGVQSLAEAMRRRGQPFDALVKQAPAATQEAIQAIFATAAQTAAESASSAELRLEAIDLLALSGGSQDVLHDLAMREPNQAVRLRALAAFARTADLETWKPFLKNFRKEAPAVRGSILDGTLARADRVGALLDEIAAGRIAPGEIDQARMNRLLQNRDPQIAPRVKQILADAIPADRQQALAEYQVALKLPSDPLRGKAVFVKNCAACHRIGDVGVDVAPDISDSRVKQPEQILTDVLQPNRAIDANFISYSVVTADGQVLTGILASETGASITLKQQEGKVVTLSREEIEELQSNGVSLMPEGLEKTIPPQDMADLISFIKNWRYLDGSIPLGER